MADTGRNLLADEALAGRNLLAEKAPAAPKEPSAFDATTDVINRGVIASALGAPVDLATMAINYNPISSTARLAGYQGLFGKPKEVVPLIEQPVGGSEWIGKQMERAGIVSPVRRPIAETTASMIPVGAGAIKGAISGLGQAGRYIQKAGGAVPEALATALRTKMSGKAEDIISSAKQAQAAPAKRIGEIAEAQQQLGAREPVAAARQTAREQDVQKSLDSLSKKDNILAEDVGGVIQPTGKQNLEKMKKLRQQESIEGIKDPAYQNARARYESGDFIENNPKSAAEFNEVIKEVQQQLERAPAGFQSELQRRFQSIMGKERPLTEGEKRVEQFRAANNPDYTPRTVARMPLSLDEAEQLRRMFKSKDLSMVEGFPALDPMRMSQLGDRLLKAMVAYEPRVGEYIKKYETMSLPINRALAGRGKMLTDLEITNAENLLFSADKQAATRYYLDGSQERAQSLLSLAGGKSPNLVDAIRGYFKTELKGMNSKQAADFVNKQEGFLREFPELKEPLDKIVRSKAYAETAGVAAEKRAGAAATRLAGEKTLAERAIEPQAKLVEKYQKLTSELTSSSAKDSLTKSKQIVGQLLNDKAISLESHNDLLKEIDSIEKMYGDSAKAKQNIDKLVKYTIGSAIGFGIGGAGISGYKVLTE